jgi:hypothetical protein
VPSPADVGEKSSKKAKAAAGGSAAAGSSAAAEGKAGKKAGGQKASGQGLVGARVSVFWPKEQAWYDGGIDEWDAGNGKHHGGCLLPRHGAGVGGMEGGSKSGSCWEERPRLVAGTLHPQKHQPTMTDASNLIPQPSASGLRRRRRRVGGAGGGEAQDHPGKG